MTLELKTDEVKRNAAGEAVLETGVETAPTEGNALIDSLVEGGPPTGDPAVVRGSIALASDESRGDRVGPGPEEYERSEHSAGAMHHYRFGPRLLDDGVEFRLFAPLVDGVELLLGDGSSQPMTRVDEGWFAVSVSGVGPGARYLFRAGGLDFPDPASRGQEEDTGGWSLVHAPMPPPQPRSVRPWHEAVIAELHVGTATPEGTFRGLAERVSHFAEAGYTAIELMPIGDFPGTHNWGYDGVLIFAPERSYGTPEDLRALVDAAHAAGLAVILDVVYNHFGPIDNYLPHYAKTFFDESVKTPWGAGLNFADPTVRLFFLENVRYWLEVFDMDGLRFDAVHEFGTEAGEDMKRQLAAMARSVKPNALLVLENLDNTASWLERDDSGRPRHFDAQWNDDIHHVLHVLTTEQRTGYFRDYADETVGKATRALAEGFTYQGEAVPRRDFVTRGTPSAHLPPTAFVSFVQNHDQIGNWPDGRRLAEQLDAERLDFLHFVIMLSPQVPMFFMGEEAHLRAPFPFFSDLKGELTEEVRAGRAEQAKEFFESEHAADIVPDPVSTETADMAKLAWDEFKLPERQAALDRFRALADLRRRYIWPLAATPYEGSSSRHEGHVVAVEWRYRSGTVAMVLNASPEQGSIEHGPVEPVATTGTIRHEGGRLQLGPWSAALVIG